MVRGRFFELIRVAVGNATALSAIPSEKDWECLFHEAKRQTLAGVLYAALDKLPEAQQPPKRILLNWHQVAEKIRYDNEAANKAASWASKKFAKVGFRNAVLKGQGNALLYPDPMLRQSGDVDIWLEGERKQIINYVRRFFPKQRVQWLEIEFPIKKDTIIEVHTTPSILFNPFDNYRLQQYYKEHAQEAFTNEVNLPGGGIICIPTSEVNLVFQLSHIYRHLFFEGIGLRQVMDYYYLIHNSQSRIHNYKEEQAKAVNVIKNLHMARFCSALMWVLGEVFGLERSKMLMEPIEKEGRFLLQEIMLAGNFGHDDARNEVKTSKWGNFWQITHRNWRFLTRYPREVMWNPVFRIVQFLWRVGNGYD